MKAFVFEHLHHERAWWSPATVLIDDKGMISSVSEGDIDPDAEHVKGLALPAMANLHSHAFQRAMVGRTQFRASESADSFWTWRERMYQLAQSMTPDDLEAVAAQLYVEMLEAGMTAVGEFHYLHHDVDGRPYSDPAEMSERIFSAAASSGIVVTHLPVLYLKGGFEKDALPAQSRFTHRNVSDYLKLFHGLQSGLRKHDTHRLGVAPHSLRAVDPLSLKELVSSIESDTRIHIHIAEQSKEVHEAQQILGTRPVKWLLDHHEVDRRWCLVHATHLDDEETKRFAATDAVAGLCPTTEADLGDGIFPARAFLESGGSIGIGTDSQVNVGVGAELRLLEYGQRLRDEQRNVLSSSRQTSVGRRLFDEALTGGAQAIGQKMGRIAEGYRADIVILDHEHPRLVEHAPDAMLDAWIFGHAESAVKQVMVAGNWKVMDGKHRAADEIFKRYRNTVRRLWM